VTINGSQCVALAGGSRCSTLCSMPDWAFPQCGTILSKAHGYPYEELQCTTPGGNKDADVCNEGENCYCSHDSSY
jgi:hypothetical protein